MFFVCKSQCLVVQELGFKGAKVPFLGAQNGTFVDPDNQFVTTTFCSQSHFFSFF